MCKNSNVQFCVALLFNEVGCLNYNHMQNNFRKLEIASNLECEKEVAKKVVISVKQCFVDPVYLIDLSAYR